MTMRFQRGVFATLAVVGCMATKGLAAEGDKKDQPKWHCEKTGSSGDVEDVEAKDKNECKQKGGKWSKAHGHEQGEKGGDHHHK
jgi:hypothetical protein